MKGFIKKSVIITIVILLIVGSAGGILIKKLMEQSPVENDINLVGAKFLEKSIVTASAIPEDTLDFNINAPQYTLPLNLSSIENLNLVLGKLGIEVYPSDLLSKNGFAAFKTSGTLANAKVYTAYSQDGPTFPSK